MYDYREQGGYTEWEELDKTSLIVEQSWHCRANQQWPPWSKINCRERVYAAPACFQPGTNATFLYCTFIRVLGTVSRGVLWNLPARLLPVWNTYVSMINSIFFSSFFSFSHIWRIRNVTWNIRLLDDRGGNHFYTSTSILLFIEDDRVTGMIHGSLNLNLTQLEGYLLA